MLRSALRGGGRAGGRSIKPASTTSWLAWRRSVAGATRGLWLSTASTRSIRPLSRWPPTMRGRRAAVRSGTRASMCSSARGCPSWAASPGPTGIFSSRSGTRLRWVGRGYAGRDRGRQPTQPRARGNPPPPLLSIETRRVNAAPTNADAPELRRLFYPGAVSTPLDSGTTFWICSPGLIESRWMCYV